jgi:hypothetical protein
VRIFKTKSLARFTKRERIADESLCKAIEDAERGLLEADLGGGLIKQRVARRGPGQKRRLPDADRIPVEAEGGFSVWLRQKQAGQNRR